MYFDEYNMINFAINYSTITVNPPEVDFIHLLLKLELEKVCLQFNSYLIYPISLYIHDWMVKTLEPLADISSCLLPKHTSFKTFCR